MMCFLLFEGIAMGRRNSKHYLVLHLDELLTDKINNRCNMCICNVHMQG